MNSMKSRINKSLIGMGVVTMVITAVICLFSLSGAYIHHVQMDMEVMADILCDGYEQDHQINFSQFSDYDMRITLISPEGTVLYESDANADTMDNHLERPEVKEALEGGTGDAHRESLTLSVDTYYYARLLNDGNILRVSLETESIFSMYTNVLWGLLGVGCLIVMVSILFSILLTKKMMEPVETMAKQLDHVVELSLYKELQPLSDALMAYQKKNSELEKLRQDFTANVSHELKTPLTTISGYAEMMENGMVKDADVPRCAEKIHKEAGRMLKLIGDILELSRLDEPEMIKDLRPVDLYQIASRCLESAELLAQRHEVSLVLEGSSHQVLGEEGMLEELVANLCDNGIRYNKPSGKVTVRVKADPRTHGTILEVQDTGIGIPEEHQRRIFERFYRVDKGRSRETGGTGLGLAIVKHIVQQHGAQIQMKSALGEGTCISVFFPPLPEDIDSESLKSRT